MAAFALRLARLDALPLTLEESGRAFDAFVLAEGSISEGWSGDLASILTALLFWLFGAGDGLARLVPALAGGTLVGAFWFTGRYLGRGAALAAAALVAFSPLAVLTSRSGLAFSLGALLSLTIVISLFAYLRQQRPVPLGLFVGSLALAPTVDSVATATGIAVIAFLLIEGALRRDSRIVRAVDSFRASRGQRATALVIVVAALSLGLTHFGTTDERLGLAGLTQWGDMFASPGDARFWGYQPALLAGYDWPLALAGTLGLLFVGSRLNSADRPVSLFGRFALLWAAVALVTVALATRRESGQLMILLLPYAVLAGLFLEEIATAADWSALRRRWIPLLAALIFIAYALLVLTEWSQDRASTTDQVYMVLALIAGALLVAAGVPGLGKGGLAVPVVAVGVLAAGFLPHSTLSLALSDGSEFAVDRRADQSVEAFAASVAQRAEEGPGPVVVDLELREPLQWYLRDSPVAYGGATGEAALYVGPAGTAPPGFTAEGQAWPLDKGWFPPSTDVLKLWRWLLFRTPFGNLDTNDAQIYAAQP